MTDTLHTLLYMYLKTAIAGGVSVGGQIGHDEFVCHVIFDQLQIKL